MIKIDENYTDFRDDTDPNYPGGKAVDAPTPESVEGTPFLAKWMNCLNGFRQALFQKAFGSLASVSGEPDHANESDTVKAIEKLIATGDDKTLADAKAHTNRTDSNRLDDVNARFARNTDGDVNRVQRADRADSAGAADNATQANRAAIADRATQADRATLADRATQADRANMADRLVSLDQIYPIGKLVIQYPNDLIPREQGLPGDWENWSHRAEEYELVPVATYNAINNGNNPPVWNNNVPANNPIMINNFRIWQPWTATRGDRRIIRANRQVTGTPQNINWIEWDDLSGIERFPRRRLQASWTVDDLAIGALVTNPRTGQQARVVGILTWSGKFPSVEGPNRPTFQS
ncbi:MAG: hypothetical protein FWC64_07180, partial [Treponema sp.]|nr:hypothetical protein [Treponema sp.]